MRVGEICTRSVSWCETGASVIDAARMMRDAHINNVIVAEQWDGERIPVGVLTDRDIVIQIVAKEVDPKAVRVGDIMGREIFTVDEDEPVSETIENMRFNGVRRLPVIDKRGAMVGVIALEDLLRNLAKDLAAIADVTSRARVKEARMYD